MKLLKDDVESLGRHLLNLCSQFAIHLLLKPKSPAVTFIRRLFNQWQLSLCFNWDAVSSGETLIQIGRFLDWRGTRLPVLDENCTRCVETVDVLVILKFRSCGCSGLFSCSPCHAPLLFVYPSLVLHLPHMVFKFFLDHFNHHIPILVTPCPASQPILIMFYSDIFQVIPLIQINPLQVVNILA